MTHRIYPVIKRVLDVGVSTLLMVFLSPLIGAVALSALLAQGRPILFSQVRPGLQGEPFRLFKFRTMRQGRRPEDSFHESDLITGFGRVLRRLSLDELPQLWNVIRGDMSLIGPRPLLMEYRPLYNARQSQRHRVRPGLTGLAQVQGRNLLSWEERLELDVQYVLRLSLSVDFRIFMKSLAVVFLGRGVNPKGSELMEKFPGSLPPATPRELGSTGVPADDRA